MVTPTAAAAAAAAADRHKKFYLCAAPKAVDYDQRVDGLLRGFGGRSKAREVVRTTLDRVQNTHKWQRKTGPGRKSNAEHAIHFYEYVLDQLGSGDEEGNESSGADEGTEEEEQSNLQQKQSENEEDESASNAEGNDSASSEPEEIRSDLCNVCFETPGRLMVCTECQRAFHLDCYRPVTTEYPTDTDWKCAYCWLASEPKYSKKRRESGAAVRLMARMKNASRRRRKQQQQEQQQDAPGEPADPGNDDVAEGEKKPKEAVFVDEEKEAPTPPASNVKGSSASSDTSEKQAQEAERKRKLALSKLADPWGEIPGDDAGRGKRSRKQPTLYDPQVSVPARHWQSDEVHFSSSDDESDDDTASTATRHGVPEGDVWCGFCNDDPLIKVCCFCGCRKCFGKHKKAKLLICDECEQEYHTFCLVPPLDSLPTRKWFCPNCKKAARNAEKNSLHEVVSAAVPTTTTLGPRKSARKPQPTFPRDASPSPSPPSMPRKRGRPFKKAEEDAAAAKTNPPKRKRGRPPKNATPNQAPPPRKRGRPPSKTASKPPSEVVANRPKPMRSADGRFVSPKRDGGNTKISPRSSSGSTSSKPKPKTAEVKSESVMSVVHISRSGRAVKRTSFHDEIEEGEQHLRSERGYVEADGSTSTRSTGVPKSISQSVVGTPQTVSFPTPSLKAPPPGMANSSATTASVSAEASSEALPALSGQPTAVARSAAGEVNMAAMARAGAATLPTMNREGFVSSKAVTAPSTAAQSAGIDSLDGDAKDSKMPRRKPGARECVQISRRFGNRVIPEKYSEILLDYCSRGKVEHLIRMRERLDEHSRYLELQLAGLESLVKEKGASNVVVPPLPEGPEGKLELGEE